MSQQKITQIQKRQAAEPLRTKMCPPPQTPRRRSCQKGNSRFYTTTEIEIIMAKNQQLRQPLDHVTVLPMTIRETQDGNGSEESDDDSDKGKSVADDNETPAK
jgi:hypothetical protein